MWIQLIILHKKHSLQGYSNNWHRGLFEEVLFELSPELGEGASHTMISEGRAL